MASKLNSLKKELQKGDTVLVTGGSGYIGTHIVEHLLKAGYKVRIYDQFVYGDKHISDLKKNKNLTLHTGEMGDAQKLMEVFNGAHAVVHLAGLVGDPASLIDEKFTIQMNIVFTRTMVEISKIFGLKRFIFASSCSVYGASNKTLTERSQLSPLSLYAKTKIDSEREILEDESPGFHPTIFRFATVFGHSRRPRFDLVVNLFVSQAYHNGIITVDGGNQWRPFVHVSDIAAAIVVSLETKPPKVDRKIFNLGDEALNTTIGELAQLVASVVRKDKKGRPVRVEINNNVTDARNYKVSFAKIKNAIGFTPKVSLKKGIEEVYKNHKNGLYKDPKNPFYTNMEMTKLLRERYKNGSTSKK